MVPQNRQSAVDLIADLEANGHEFTYFQAMRLLEQVAKIRPENFVITADASLTFPVADIRRISIARNDNDDVKADVTVRFMGLYGVASSLPAFMAEEVLEDLEDGGGGQVLLDFINQRVYDFLYESIRKYRLFLNVAETSSLSPDLGRLLALMGTGGSRDTAPDEDMYQLLRYLPLLTQATRSASGLQALLRDYYQDLPVAIEPAIASDQSIPEGQRFRLGEENALLGVSAHLGSQVADRMFSVSVSIGPVSHAQYQQFLPGQEQHQKLRNILKAYVVDPLVFNLNLSIRNEEASSACLGESIRSIVGHNMWLMSESSAISACSAIFSLPY